MIIDMLSNMQSSLASTPKGSNKAVTQEEGEEISLPFGLEVMQFLEVARLVDTDSLSMQCATGEISKVAVAGGMDDGSGWEDQPADIGYERNRFRTVTTLVSTPDRHTGPLETLLRNESLGVSAEPLSTEVGETLQKPPRGESRHRETLEAPLPSPQKMIEVSEEGITHQEDDRSELRTPRLPLGEASHTREGGDVLSPVTEGRTVSSAGDRHNELSRVPIQPSSDVPSDSQSVAWQSSSVDTRTGTDLVAESKEDHPLDLSSPVNDDANLVKQTRESSHSIHLRWKGEDQSAVTLRLRVSQGDLSGQLRSPDIGLLRDLQAELPQLRRQLQVAGYQGVDIDVGSHNQSSGGSTGQEQWTGGLSYPEELTDVFARTATTSHDVSKGLEPIDSRSTQRLNYLV